MLSTDRRRPRCENCSKQHLACDRGSPCSKCTKYRKECVYNPRHAYQRRPIISETTFNLNTARYLPASFKESFETTNSGHHANTAFGLPIGSNLDDTFAEPQGDISMPWIGREDESQASLFATKTAQKETRTAIRELGENDYPRSGANPESGLVHLAQIWNLQHQPQNSHSSAIDAQGTNLFAARSSKYHQFHPAVFKASRHSAHTVAYTRALTSIYQRPLNPRFPASHTFGAGSSTTSQPRPCTSGAPFDFDMSLSYENRGFMQEPANYPQMQMHEDVQDAFKHEQTRYPSPPAPDLSDNPYQPQHANLQTRESNLEGEVRAAMAMPELSMQDLSDAPSPGRSKAILKPDRGHPPKDANGRFICNWIGCTEEIKNFGRKCEWSKHMDKHDRPYKCPAEGCEKLPGFTYSGGLLRHEREVHNKHGGPRKQLNCPHPNCKRHTGKGFSRQENLNEHLRRVHTDSGVAPAIEESEEDGNENKIGQKRKRGTDSDPDVMEELKRLRQENDNLRRAQDAHMAQTTQMLAQMNHLQQQLQQQQQQQQQSMHMQAPQAQMM